MKKKRNKKYIPKSINVNSMLQTINLSRPVSIKGRNKLNESIYGALEAITKGFGNTEHFDVLASTVDIVFMMSMNLFDDAYAEEIDLARMAMFRLKDRFHKHDVFGFDGEGYQAIKEVVAIHDELMKNVTGAEVLQFMNAIMLALKNGNFYKSDEERAAA